MKSAGNWRLKALQESAGSWKDEDHPELKAGSRAWIKKIRKENEHRLAHLLPHD